MRRQTMRGALVLAMTAMAACGPRPEAKTQADASKGPIPVTVAPVVQEDVVRRVDVTGTLAPWEEAVIALEADGRIVELKADLGDHVKKGQVLVRIAPEEYQIRRTQAEVEVAAAEADFARVSELVGKDMASRQQLDESRRRLDASRAGADMARKKLRDTQLVSPIDGVVSRRYVNAGEYGRTGSPAFQVVRVTPLKLKVDVPERYTADVKVGDAVEAVSESFPGALKGKVVRIGAAVAAESRSFPVEAEMDNPDEAVKPGTFARVSIGTGSAAKALTVPEGAVATFAGNPRVFVLAEGRAKERTVELGGKVRDRYVVAKGLQAGETVIVTGLDLLSDGAAVAAR